MTEENLEDKKWFPPMWTPPPSEMKPIYSSKRPIKRSIKEMTYDELCHIANIATGGYFNSEWSRDHKEVEVGGYGWRRRVEWTQNTEGYDEYHYFEITGENKGNGWQWHCKVTDKMNQIFYELNGEQRVKMEPAFGAQPPFGNSHTVNTLNPHQIVDYCREQGLDIENTLR
jgi:hypothetical protein